jgi:hypothetical protein
MFAALEEEIEDAGMNLHIEEHDVDDPNEYYYEAKFIHRIKFS